MKNLGIGIVVFALAVGGTIWLNSAGSSPEPGDPDSSEIVPKLPANHPVPSPTGPHPKVIVEQTDHQFGVMPIGDGGEHRFAIRNDGEADLKLLAGEPTCQCTKFELSQTVVKPGEEAYLNVDWDAKYTNLTFQHGGPVYTNDPERTEINFSIRGIVDAAVSAKPEGRWHLVSASGAEGVFEGSVVTRLYDSLTIESMEYPEEHFKVTPTPVDAKEMLARGLGDDYLCGIMLKVEISPDARPGIVTGDLKIKFDCSPDPVVIPLGGKKDGPIKILPAPGTIWSESKNGLVLGRFAKNKGRSAELDLMVSADGLTEPLEFTVKKTNPKHINVTIGEPQKIGDNKLRYKLGIAIAPGIPAISRDTKNPGRILIGSNHPSGQEIEIKVSYTAF